jgi:aspartate kinase/aspartokinase/homoserine dehydrogenase 1
MSKIVAKFGGSNLKNKADIQKVVRIVRNYGRPMVIVVSAFYGITDFLTRGISDVLDDRDQVEVLVRSLTDLKGETIRESIDDPDAQEAARLALGERLDRLEKYLKGIHYIGEIPESVRDSILSYGERLSSLLLSLTLKHHGIEAEEALPEKIGLLTDGEYRNATVQYELSAPSVSRALAGDKVYVIPGFYGISEAGKVNLLGRGGSDYSAAAIARCIGAESLDIWKDVAGFRSADPKLVANSRPIAHLSYREAAELSYFGARILHPRTVEPLLKPNIPIRIFNVDDPDPELEPVTVISREGSGTSGRARSVTYTDDLAILKISGAGVGLKPGILARVTSALESAGINLKSVVTAQTAINLYLQEEDLDRAAAAVEGLEMASLTEILPRRNLSIIAMVGEEIADHPEIAEQMLEALAEAGIPYSILSLGASQAAAYFVIPRERRPEAVRVLHERIFGE